MHDNEQEINFEVTATKKGFLIFSNEEYLHFYKAQLSWDTFSGIEIRDKNGKTDQSLWKIEEVKQKSESAEEADNIVG